MKERLSGYLALATTLCLLLAACNETETEAKLEDQDENCGQSEVLHLIGKDQSILSLTDLPKPYRILTPNTVMTMDMRPERLNIYINGHGEIEKLTCG